MFDTLLVDISLLTLAVIIAVAIVQVRSLLCAIMLSGIYSLLMAMIWQNMNAVDVAFTEASVGAGISTVLLLGTLLHTKRQTKQLPTVNWGALTVVTVTGAFLIYGTLDMPDMGDPNAPIHTGRVVQQLGQRVGKVDREGIHHPWKYSSMAEQSVFHEDDEHPWAELYAEEYGTAEPEHGGEEHGGAHAHPTDDFMGHSPNTVTSLLAAYRGYDTMYETAVIFTAGMSLILLLRRRREEGTA